MKINKLNALRKNKKNKYRVRRSVYPTNRIILAEHGVRQVLFPYDLSMSVELIKFSVWSFGNLRHLPVGFLIKNACRNLELKPFAFWVLRPNELVYKDNMGTIHFLSDGEVQLK